MNHSLGAGSRDFPPGPPRGEVEFVGRSAHFLASKPWHMEVISNIMNGILSGMYKSLSMIDINHHLSMIFNDIPMNYNPSNVPLVG